MIITIINNNNNGAVGHVAAARAVTPSARPVSLLVLQLIRLLDSNLPGKSLWT